MSRAGLVVAFAVFGALGYVGTKDFDDAQAEQVEYCANVASGLWPDYQKTYRKFCEKGLPREKKSDKMQSR